MNFLNKLFFSQKESKKGRLNLAVSDRQKIEDIWTAVEQLQNLAKPSAFREAVIEADKLVDFALDKMYPGKDNAAERLKEAKELFERNRQDYENLWYAHKLRNEMVHTVGFELPTQEAKVILGYFKRALEIIGVK